MGAASLQPTGQVAHDGGDDQHKESGHKESGHKESGHKESGHNGSGHNGSGHNGFGARVVGLAFKVVALVRGVGAVDLLERFSPFGGLDRVGPIHRVRRLVPLLLLGRLRGLISVSSVSFVPLVGDVLQLEWRAPRFSTTADNHDGLNIYNSGPARPR